MTLDRLWAGWRSGYIEEVTARPPEGCLFCGLLTMADDEALILERAAHCFTVMNAYPYTSGHLMVAPTRHAATLTELSAPEAASVMHAAQRAATALDAAFGPEGMNVGMNIGRAGGAGVPGHLHVHVLGRWAGDTNFMTSVAEARVLPESLRGSYERLRSAWPQVR